jgi:RNA polymerase sigma factor (sigma-70 family)
MSSPPSNLQPVLDQLSFALDDTEAVNRAFQTYRNEGREEAEEEVEVWTYCYVYRYFMKKFGAGSIQEAADADDLVARAFQKTRRKRSSVQDPSRYAHWVSVVCKNTFLNYARRDRVAQSIDDEEGPELVAEDPLPSRGDIGFVRQAFERAVGRLPEYLQEPARLYFLENHTFQEIAEVIGKSVPTVRTYKHKAVKRLREDEELRAYVDGPDSEM